MDSQLNLGWIGIRTLWLSIDELFWFFNVWLSWFCLFCGSVVLYFVCGYKPFFNFVFAPLLINIFTFCDCSKKVDRRQM